jgi:hypothetical protein
VDHLSVYLDVADSASLPYGWNRFAHFNLAVMNQFEPKSTVKKGQSPVCSGQLLTSNRRLLMFG